MDPIISIITPTYNRGNTLETAIKSVIDQDIPEIEHIIVDGNSQDNTREIIRKYPSVRFYSEPDEGLYYAFNKGLKLARGKYIGWLNSDDYYKPSLLNNALSILLSDVSIVAVFGAAEVVFPETKKQPVLIPCIHQNEILQRAALDSIPINACLIRREEFIQLGGFDTQYKIAADRDFLFRFGLAQYRYASLELVLYTFQTHPTSLTFGNNNNTKIQGDMEEMSMALKYMAMNNVTGTKAKLCKQWHSRASADAALLWLLGGHFKYSIKMMKSGLR